MALAYLGAEELAWRSCQPAISSYELILRFFPIGRHARQARARLEELCLQEAERQDTIAAYEDVLRRFPVDGPTRERAAYKLAEKKCTVPAFEAFLREHPGGRLARAAKERVEELMDWQRASDANTIESWRGFGRTHRGTALGSRAWEAYQEALGRAARSGMSGEADLALPPEFAASLLRTRRIGTDPGARFALSFLVAFVGAQSRGERFAIPAIRPERPLPVCDRGEHLAAAFYGMVRSSLEPDVELRVAGQTLLEESSGAAFLLSSDGQLAVELPGAWLAGVAGSVTIEARPNRGVWLRPALSGQGILVKVPWMGAAEPIVPATTGSVLRIAGRIVDLFVGWTFEGAKDDPLTLIFLEDGLTYVGGAGRITAPGGEEHEFPSAVTGVAPWQDSKPAEGAALKVESVRLDPVQRAMTIDPKESLLWLRDPSANDCRPLVAVDLSRQLEREGQTYVAVADGFSFLSSPRNDDFILDGGNTWVSTAALECDDAWDRYWDADRQRSWYHPRSNREMLLRRFTKRKDKAFLRRFREESWSGPDRPGNGATEEVKIVLAESRDSFSFEGKMSFAFGTCLDPVGPLIRGIEDKTSGEIELWLTQAGANPIPLLVKEIVSLKSVASRRPLPFKDLLDGLDHAPRLTRLLTDRRENFLQKLAEAVDADAGDMVFSRFLGDSGGFRPFQHPGSTYDCALSEKTPYPIGTGLAIWGGAIKVVADADGRPATWIADGTRYRMKVVQRLTSRGSPAGSVVLTLAGAYRHGHPKYVATLRREGSYKAGPVLSEVLTFHGGLEVDQVPEGERFELGRFGEILKPPAR